MSSNTKYNIFFNLIILLIVCVVSLILGSFMFSKQNTAKIIEGVNGEFITAPKRLFDVPKQLKTNWGVSFTMTMTSGSDGNWQQILGITPFSDGRDARFFGAWVCPWNTTMHFRTATPNDPNANISHDTLYVPINQSIRFDIISNCPSDTQQIIQVFMANVDKGESLKLVANVTTLPPGKYSPRYGYNQAWLFETYSGYKPFTGKLKDVVFATGDSPISLYNLQNAIDYLHSSESKQHFTTMREGLTENPFAKDNKVNIGGLGTNGGIAKYSPPNVTLPVQLPRNYLPIKDDAGQDLCPKSVVQINDPKLDLIKNGGYNMDVSKGSDMTNNGSVPICSPDDIYKIQNQILKEINKFNSEYSDYMTYRYNMKHSVAGDTSPQLKYQNGTTDNEQPSRTFQGISNVADLPSYKKLNQDLQTFGNILSANKAYYPDPDPQNPDGALSKLDPVYLNKKHIDMVKIRRDLDAKLFELNNVQNSEMGSSKIKMDANIYVTILWTTLATSVVYFMFRHM